jgi:multiple sugar transport system substrate-binding protein
LPYPYFESGEKIAIQQGAGMCVTKSDEAHEYASALFLKWFTDSAQNLKFAVSTGYFPVKNSVLEASQMIEQIDAGNVTSPAIVESIKATEIMFNNYTLYNSKPFLGSYEMRTLLDTHLITKIQNDLEYLNTQIEAGEDRDKILSNLTSGDSFEEWYQDLLNESTLILNGN